MGLKGFSVLGLLMANCHLRTCSSIICSMERAGVRMGPSFRDACKFEDQMVVGRGRALKSARSMSEKGRFRGASIDQVIWITCRAEGLGVFVGA